LKFYSTASLANFNLFSHNQGGPIYQWAGTFEKDLELRKMSRGLKGVFGKWRYILRAIGIPPEFTSDFLVNGRSMGFTMPKNEMEMIGLAVSKMRTGISDYRVGLNLLPFATMIFDCMCAAFVCDEFNNNKFWLENIWQTMEFVETAMEDKPYTHAPSQHLARKGFGNVGDTGVDSCSIILLNTTESRIGIVYFPLTSSEIVYFHSIDSRNIETPSEPGLQGHLNPRGPLFKETSPSANAHHGLMRCVEYGKAFTYKISQHNPKVDVAGLIWEAGGGTGTHWRARLIYGSTLNKGDLFVYDVTRVSVERGMFSTAAANLLEVL
jgi:hypothetical protein